MKQNLRKGYQKPAVSVVRFDAQDVIVTSGERAVTMFFGMETQLDRFSTDKAAPNSDWVAAPDQKAAE